MEGFKLYMRFIQKSINRICRTINMVFYRVGADIVPPEVQYAIVASSFLIPFTLMCYIACCYKGGKDEEEVAKKNESKKSTSSSRREKLEWSLFSKDN